MECGRISRAAQSFSRPPKRPRTSFGVFWFIFLNMYQHCWTRETLTVPLYFSMGCPNMSPIISRQACFDIFRHRHASPKGASLPEHYVKRPCSTVAARALSPYSKTKINWPDKTCFKTTYAQLPPTFHFTPYSSSAHVA